MQQTPPQSTPDRKPFLVPATANSLAAWRWGDGRQFRRQSKAHIFIDQIEIALVRETKFREPLANLFDEYFGCGGARGQADTCNAFEPFHVDVFRRVDQLRFDAAALRDFHQAVGIGAVGRAVEQVAKDVDLILVVGSPNSSNSNRLVEVAQRSGVKAQLIDSAKDIDVKWLEGIARVGLTAGASAPEVLVEQVSERLAEFGFTDQRDLDLIDEDVRFTLPPELATIAPA